MLEALGGDQSKVWTQVRHLVPLNAQGLTDGSLYSPLNICKSNLCKVALKVLSTHSIGHFRSLASPALITGDGRLTTAGVIQAARTHMQGAFSRLP